jgi:hypothetical protein
MNGLSASGLADLAGVTEPEVARLVELGILVARDGPDPFLDTDVQKVRLAAGCEQAGLPMEAIAAVIRAGRLSFASRRCPCLRKGAPAGRPPGRRPGTSQLLYRRRPEPSKLSTGSSIRARRGHPHHPCVGRRQRQCFTSPSTVSGDLGKRRVAQRFPPDAGHGSGHLTERAVEPARTMEVGQGPSLTRSSSEHLTSPLTVRRDLRKGGSARR